MGNQAFIWFAAGQAKPAAPRDEVEQVYDAAAQLFAVLSCPTRLSMACQLRRGALAVRQVAEACGVSQPCASNHLKTMWMGGLLLRECRGREVLYALRPSPWLQDLCDFAWQVRDSGELAPTARRTEGGSR